jgi:putative membrane protein
MQDADTGSQPLTEAEAASIEARVRTLETKTGVQVVAAVVERSDMYHGLRWRAFAIAASLAGFCVAALDTLRPTWPTGHSVPLALALVLGAGAAAAVAATVAPKFARLFLETLRADAEIRRRAESLFLSRELFRTRGRTAVLILASRFERRAAVYADRGLSDHLPESARGEVTARMNPLLAAGRTADALLAGLDAAEPLLAGRPAPAGRDGANELPDRPIAAEESR